MAKTKKQLAADAAFIEKLKTVNVSTTTTLHAQLSETKCEGCGESLLDHVLGIGLAVSEVMTKRKIVPRAPSADQQSFAA